jgi:tetratricopeptide (TPR) repeat protein
VRYGHVYAVPGTEDDRKSDDVKTEEDAGLAAALGRTAHAQSDETERLPEDGALVPGTRVGRYVIRRLLGEGAMGAVYGAHDPELAREVAIKLLHSRGPASGPEKLADRMRREAHAMARLSHPNVIIVHDVGTHDGRVFVAMELVDGGTLRDWLRERQRSTREILAVMERAGRGLAAAHAAGLVHRDFKPDNVLVAKDGGVKVSDFGLARTVGAQNAAHRSDADGLDDGRDLAITETGVVVGTPAYMAPEQMAGDETDARADVFAFCVCLHEALYGERPFAGSSVLELRKNIEAGALRSPPMQRRRIPARVRRAILEGLRADLSTRARSMARVLEAMKTSSPRSRLLLGATAAVVALAAIVATALALRARVETPSRFYAEGRPRPSVAILGIRADTTRAGDPALGMAVTEVLRYDLEEGGRGFRVVAADRVAQTLTDMGSAATEPLAPDVIDKLHVRLDADYLVVGTLVTDASSSGRRSVLAEAKLVDTARHTTVGSFRERADDKHVVDLGLTIGDAMRRRVRAAPVSQPEAASVRARLPSGVDAQTAYAQALTEGRSQHYVQARPLLDRVIQMEPNFAFGHAELARMLMAVGFVDRAREEARVAFGLSDGLPRDERLRLELAYRRAAHEWDRALEIARAIYTFYPDDLRCGLDIAVIQSQAGDPKQALATTDALHTLPPPRGDDPEIDFAEGNAAINSGDLARAKRANERALEAGRTRADRLTMSNATAALAYVLMRSGDLDGALAQAADAARLAHDAGDPTREASALDVEGIALDHVGRWNDAESVLQTALTLQRENGAQNSVQVSLNSLGNAAYDGGDVRASRSFFEQAREQAEKIGFRRSIAVAESGLGRATCELGLPNEAIGHFDAALGAWNAMQDKSSLSEARLWGAESTLATGDATSAEREVREASQAYEALGREEEAAGARMVLARMLNDDLRADALDVALSAEHELDRHPRNAALASAHAEVARAMLAAGRSRDAAAEARGVRARILVSTPALVHADALIAADRVLGQVGTADERAAARDELDQLISEAQAAGTVAHELRARLVRAEVEATAGDRKEARTMAALLATDATARGFATIARAAGQLSK